MAATKTGIHCVQKLTEVVLPGNKAWALYRAASALEPASIFGINSAYTAQRSLSPFIQSIEEFRAARDIYKEERAVAITGMVIPEETLSASPHTEEDVRKAKFLTIMAPLHYITAAAFLFVTESDPEKLFRPSHVDHRVIRPVIPNLNDGPAYTRGPLGPHNDRSGCSDIVDLGILYVNNGNTPLEVLSIKDLLKVFPTEVINGLCQSSFRTGEDPPRPILEKVSHNKYVVNYADFLTYTPLTPEAAIVLNIFQNTLSSIPFKEAPKEGLVVVKDPDNLHKRGETGPDRLALRIHSRKRSYSHTPSELSP